MIRISPRRIKGNIRFYMYCNQAWKSDTHLYALTLNIMVWLSLTLLSISPSYIFYVSFLFFPRLDWVLLTTAFKANRINLLILCWDHDINL